MTELIAPPIKHDDIIEAKKYIRGLKFIPVDKIKEGSTYVYVAICGIGHNTRIEQSVQKIMYREDTRFYGATRGLPEDLVIDPAYLDFYGETWGLRQII